MYNKKIIVAIDNDNFKEILETIKLLKKEAFAFKLGYEFFYNFGIEFKKKILKYFLILSYTIYPIQYIKPLRLYLN